jgi:uncharacterized protein
MTEEGPGAGGQGPADAEPGDTPEHSRAETSESQSDSHSTPTPEPPAPGPRPPAPVFWTYSDLFLFIGLAVPAMLAGFGLVRGTVALFHLRPLDAAETILIQTVGYLFLFLILVVIFRLQYDRPFWDSLAWRPIRLSPLHLVVAGWATAIAVNLFGYLIHTPTTSNPLTDLMESRTGLILVTLYGVTLGPLAEELAFRGFIQPLLVRSAGAIGGIVLTALPFGLLHYRQYGNSWRHALLITGSGVAFGWMRQVTGSTKASTLMHSAYNLLFFMSLWALRQGH